MPTPPRPPEPRSGVDRALVKALKDREERGVPANTVDGTVIVGFNDPAALAQALKRRDVAIVLTEAAITNTIGLLLPVDGFHAELRRLTREAGTLLGIDETHTQVAGAGGLTRRWGLAPDLVTMGKSIAGGLPVRCLGHDRGGRGGPGAAQGPGRRTLQPRRDRRHDRRQRLGIGGGARGPDRDLEDVDAYLAAWDSLLDALTA